MAQLAISSTSSFSLLSAFPPPNPFLNPNFPHLKLYPLNSTLHIFSKSLHSHSQAQHKAISSNTEDTAVLIPESDSDGSGLASPSRGEVFLERQRYLAEIKKHKANKSKEKVQKATKVVHGCYGCGAGLQTSEVDAPGYVEPDTYELKKKHHQLRSILCGRCRLLSHGHMITAVGGNGGYPGGKQFVTAEELREKLANLRHEKALIIKLVDIVDFNGSFLSHIRDIVGANPIILVVTKVDLLPKETDFNCIGDWVVEATTKKKLNVLSVHLTSSKSLVGITGVVSEIQKEKKGRNVYILGSANVGKSAFISALLNMLSYNDPAAASARRYKPIQSAVPGTTLGPIQIDAFLSGGPLEVGFIDVVTPLYSGTLISLDKKLYDTPGVHLHHRQAAVVHAGDLPALAPQSRLRGQSFPLELPSSGVQTRGLMGFSIFWGGLVRIDVIKALPETSLTFYGPKALRIHLMPSEVADMFYQKETGGLLTPPTGKERAAEWKGLETLKKLEIKYEDIKRPACDVAISGLGWICVEPVNKSRRRDDDFLEEEESSGKLVLAIHVPKPVEIFVRSPIPVGPSGAGWYEFRDLTEKEEEERPKWYF